jgi:hypothetical protein
MTARTLTVLAGSVITFLVFVTVGNHLSAHPAPSPLVDGELTSHALAARIAHVAEINTGSDVVAIYCAIPGRAPAGAPDHECRLTLHKANSDDAVITCTYRLEVDVHGSTYTVLSRTSLTLNPDCDRYN